MNRTHPLFQFMPYGAPELLASERPRLSRAIVTGSAAMLLTFATAIVLFPHGVHVPVAELERTVIILDGGIKPPPPLFVPPSPPKAAAAQPKNTSKLGAVVPVDEAPPAEPDLGSDPGTETVGTGDFPVTPIVPTTGIPPSEVLPNIGEYVYADQVPVTIDSIKPDYPRFAQDAGVEGIVIVYALVGRDGRVVRVQVDERRSEVLLNEAALAAARKWTFHPAMASGHPVAVWVSLTFKFTLR
jgi:periplasmic protein TonB